MTTKSLVLLSLLLAVEVTFSVVATDGVTLLSSVALLCTCVVSGLAIYRSNLSSVGASILSLYLALLILLPGSHRNLQAFAADSFELYLSLLLLFPAIFFTILVLDFRKVIRQERDDFEATE